MLVVLSSFHILNLFERKKNILNKNNLHKTLNTQQHTVYKMFNEGEPLRTSKY